MGGGMTTYTEEEFIACLLVNGWARFHDYDNSQTTYWQQVDAWFKKMWPDQFISDDRFPDDRFPIVIDRVNQANSHDTTKGQMEFKMQFWNWGRALFDTPVLSVDAPLK